MKKNISKILVLILAVVSFAACKSDDMNFKDAKVTAVYELYTPTDGLQLNLAPTANLYFSWAPASVADGGAPLYEVLFDKVGGDFSSPIYVIPSDNNGYNSGATIPNKTLNQIMYSIGVKSGEVGSIIWTVRSSRGINQVLSPVSDEIQLTRYLGFDNPPTQLYLTGSGTEAGTNWDDALPMVKTADGEFELYTELTSGTYSFIDGNYGTPREFYVNANNIIKEEIGVTGTVTTPGIYRVTLDFNSATMTLSEIVDLGYFYCNAGSVEWYLTYQGKGIWTGSGSSVKGSATDNRYRFNAQVKTNGITGTELFAPTTIGNDDAPTVPVAASYYYLSVYTYDYALSWCIANKANASEIQWWPKWKLASDYVGVTVNATINMSSSPYTLQISK